jgi:hypothetical protein
MSSSVARSLLLAMSLMFIERDSSTIVAAEAFTTASIRGRVVFLAEALERLHGVKLA